MWAPTPRPRARVSRVPARASLVAFVVATMACSRDDTRAPIHAPLDRPITTASSSAQPPPTPRPTPPEFAMVAIVEGDPFGAAIPPAGASLEVDAVASTRFVRFPLLPGDTLRDGCAALMKWAAKTAKLPIAAALVCGEDRHVSPLRAVRSWMIDPTPLLARADVKHAEIRYDEDVMPLHGHVVCELLPASVTRWNAWAKGHPKVRIALLLGPDVIDVDDVGPATLTGGELWITPKVSPVGLRSNDPETRALAAAMSGDAGAP